MKITRLAAATAVAALMSASAASALTLTPTGFSGGSQSVSVTAPTKSGLSAGGFNVTSDGTPSSLIAFCLDIVSTISFGNSYQYTETATPFTGNSQGSIASAMSRIQALYDAVYDNSVATASSLTSAGFQLALWNAVYDDDWTVTNDGAAGNDFYATAGGGIIGQANTYLTAASAYVGGQKWDLTYLEGNPTNSQGAHPQNLVTAAPAPVPLPAAGLMLLGALGGLVGLRRRRKAA